MVKKIVLFGSGQFGYGALTFFGDENIECFCDNNRSLIGTEKYGKTVISFTDLKENYGKAIVIIAVAGRDAYAIAEQCEKNGISDYLIYTYLRKTFPECDGNGLLHFISDPINRMRVRKDIYYKQAAELKGQLDYLRKHADARHMKPATGELRYKQEQCVRASTLFFKKISTLGIKPVLYSGNLLGYVRHNGFIPWDDDIDFALIGKDYEKLKEYCRQHICTRDELYGKTEVCGKEILPGLECYYWTLLHDHFSIVEVGADDYKVGMDFFHLEYYADHYSLKELRALASQIRDEVVRRDSEEERIQCVEKALEKNKKNTAEKSDQIYFALDNMEMQNRWHKGQFIPEDVVLPLKEVEWEGELFWVPNDAEEFVTYEYESPWELPDDVGIPLHR